MENCESQNFSTNPKKESENIFSSKHNTIAIYTVLSIFVKMRHQLGLEAMLEYMNEYLRTIEKNNPKIKNAVYCALQLIDVEKIYDDAMRHKSK